MNAGIGRACDRYDLAEAKLKSFTRSAVRTKVMLCLMGGEMNAAQLEREMSLRSSTILHSVKEMIESNLVIKTDKGYALTNIGKIEALILDELVSTIVTLDQHQDFWMSHDLSSIPMNLLNKIGMLGTSEVIKGNPAAVLKPQENFIAELKRSKEIYGVSPIIVPGYAEAIYEAIANGAQVDLILTEAILDMATKETELREATEAILKCENFRLYKLKENITVAFTVTESLLSLGFFRLDGLYDLGSDLICTSESARAWGKELFEHYRQMSERITSLS